MTSAAHAVALRMRQRRRLVATALSLLSVWSATPVAQEGVVDLSRQTTPACEIAGLTARPAAGWFNVPFEEPPSGHLGCQMMRTGEQDELVGIIRVRSVTAPQAEFTDDGYARLLANEVVAVTEMGYALADEPLWIRENVPVSGAGFREGRAVGLAARIKGNDIAQEAHFLTFRSDRANYVFTLLTPARSYDEALWQRNTADFGAVFRTLQPRK